MRWFCCSSTSSSSTPVEKMDEKNAIGLSSNSQVYLPRWYLFWSILMFFVSMYLVCGTLFRVCFPVDFSVPVTVVDVFCDVFVMMDIIFSFTLPFSVRGITIYDRSLTAKNYLKGWFGLDLVAWLPLDLANIFGPYTALWRLNKMIRLFRLFYALSILEHFGIIKAGGIRLIRFFFAILLQVHFFACMFVIVVRAEGELGELWIENPGMLSQPTLYQYLKCFHASIALTTGYGGPYPTTELEVYFSLAIVTMGVAVYITIIGAVGLLITQLDASASTFQHKLDKVNDYMTFRGIPGRIQKRVQSYFSYIWDSRRGIDESAIMADLPTYLQTEIAIAAHMDMISSVKWFKEASPEFLGALMTRLKPMVILPGTYIIRAGEVGSEMYFISRGDVSIVGKKETGWEEVVQLHAGQFFGEIALLVDVARTASVRAITYCDLYMLTKDDLWDVMEEYPQESEPIRAAARDRELDNRKDAKKNSQSQKKSSKKSSKKSRKSPKDKGEGSSSATRADASNEENTESA